MQLTKPININAIPTYIILSGGTPSLCTCTCMSMQSMTVRHLYRYCYHYSVSGSLLRPLIIISFIPESQWEFTDTRSLEDRKHEYQYVNKLHVFTLDSAASGQGHGRGVREVCKGRAPCDLSINNCPLNVSLQEIPEMLYSRKSLWAQKSECTVQVWESNLHTCTCTLYMYNTQPYIVQCTCTHTCTSNVWLHQAVWLLARLLGAWQGREGGV